jgi:hypothetical protein
MDEYSFSDEFWNSVRWLLTQNDDVVVKYLLNHPDFANADYLKQLTWVLRGEIRRTVSEIQPKLGPLRKETAREPLRSLRHGFEDCKLSTEN